MMNAPTGKRTGQPTAVVAAPRRRMIVFDTAYTYAMLVDRALLTNITARDHGGFFDHVWTVHPAGTIFHDPEDPERYGPPLVRRIADRHTLVEGRMGRFRALRRFARLNFLLAQAELAGQLLWILVRQRVAVIRAEDPLFNGAFGWLLARLTGRPLMIGVWGNPGAVRRQTGEPLSPRLFATVAQEARFEQWVLRHADCVMVQNEDNRDFVMSCGVPRENTVIFRIGNLLHEAHFVDPASRPDGTAELRALGVEEGEPALICISRLEHLKLVDSVIWCVKHLADAGCRVKALMVGDGTARDDLQALARKLGVEEQIVFCGFRDQQWLARVLPQTSVVLSPLTGRALGEAALGGVPCVAYDIDWHSELMESGVTGELVPVHDHAAMAKAVKRILDDPDYARRIGKNVRQRMLDMMAPEVVDRDQTAAYAAVLRRKPRWRRRAALT